MKIHEIAALSLSIGCAACTTVPQPKDISGKETVEIVQQIRCEVRDALIRHLIEALLSVKDDLSEPSDAHLEWKRQRTLIWAGLIKFMTDRNNEIKEGDPGGKLPFFNHTSGTVTYADFLAEFSERNLVYNEFARKEIKILNSNLGRNSLSKEDREFYKSEIKRFEKTIKTGNERIKNNLTKKTIITSDLFYWITYQELDNKAADRIKMYIESSIGYVFSFTNSELNNKNADFTFTLPFTTGGMFTLGLKAGTDLTRNNARTFTLRGRFVHYADVGCRSIRYPTKDVPLLRATQANILYPIAGKIGVAAVIDTFIALADNQHHEKLNPYKDTLTFTTKISASVTPTITLNAPSAERLKLTKGSFGSADSRTDIHQVAIILGLPSKAVKIRRIVLNPKSDIKLVMEVPRPVSRKRKLGPTPGGLFAERNFDETRLKAADAVVDSEIIETRKERSVDAIFRLND